MQEEASAPVNTAENKRILVTGAAGLVGNEVTKQLLEAGLHVTALYHSAPLNLSHPHLTITHCDILDTTSLEEIMESITHVLHCAALISYHQKDEAKLYKVNVEGTANVVNACMNAHVQKLIHVSSVAALGRAPGKHVTEQMMWNEETNKSIYGRSKYFSELEVWRGIGEGLNAAIINPSIILGGDNWNNGSTALFKSAYNEFQYYTNGSTGFVDVRDVAHAMIMLMNSKISVERFILSAENISYKELFTMMAKCFSKKPPYKKAGGFLSEIVWKLEAVKVFFTNKKALITKETARNAQSVIQYDNSKFLTAFPGFGYKNIPEAVEHVCKILKEKYHLQ